MAEGGQFLIVVDDYEAFHDVCRFANKFSTSFFKCAVDQNPNNNLISSPLSVSMILTMVKGGAIGETKNNLMQVLLLPASDNVAHAGYRILMKTLNEQPLRQIELLFAHKIFAINSHPVQPSFEHLTQTYFQSSTQLVDFMRNEETADRINSWVARNTSDLIIPVINADEVGDGTTMVLVNAVKFKGHWEKMFHPSLTVNRPFYVAKDRIRHVPTMYRRGIFKCGQLNEMHARFVEIPYSGREIRMVIIVPNRIDGLAEVNEKMKDTCLLNIMRRVHSRSLEVFLPKFRTVTQIDINKVLRSVGLNHAFGDKANFSGISDASLRIDKVVQKMSFEINEDGDEESVLNRYSNIPHINPMSTFRVDRPSYFTVYHVKNYVMLFNGIISAP